MATAKNLHTQAFTFQQIPIYFQENSPNLVELSFSLSELWAKNLKGGAEHPHSPGRIGLKGILTIKLLLIKLRKLEVIVDNYGMHP